MKPTRLDMILFVMECYARFVQGKAESVDNAVKLEEYLTELKGHNATL